MDRFSPSEAALEGLRLARAHPGVMLAWSAVYMGGLLLIILVMIGTLGPEVIALTRKGGLAPDDVEAMSNLVAQSMPAFLVLLVMSAGLWSIITAGVLRLVLRPTEHGFAHLRLGKEELRLTLANLLCIAIYMVSAIVGVVLVGALKASGPVALWLGALAGVSFALWLGIRLSLLLPTVFVTGRLSLVEAWQQTRGQFWNLLGMVFMAVVFYVIIWLGFFIVSSVLVAVSGGAEAVRDPAHVGVLAALTTVITLIMQLVIQVLQIVMIYAPTAYAYRALTSTTVPAPEAPSASPFARP